VITLRWNETERYDVIADAEVCQLQAITSRGTWYADVPLYPGLAESRRKFKARAIECIAAGDEPGPVDMEEAEA
jgi:hypothetical protein